MTSSPTLFRYIGRQFLFWFAAVLLILGAVIAVFEFVEFVRQASSRLEEPLGLALVLTGFKLPSSIELIFHFAVLFSAMFTFWRLTRSQELVVARAAGLSAWQFILPVAAAALLIGGLKVTLVNPVSAALYARYERLDTALLGGGGDVLNVSTAGLWLRQRDADGIAVIHAERAEGDGTRLQNVIFLLLGPDESYRGRVDAAAAALRGGAWDIEDAWVSEGTEPARHLPRYSLPSNLTADGIQERFASPQTLSFWDLPEFIQALDATGFSSLRYRLAYQSLLAQPLLMIAMVLIAAAFSLRPGRRADRLLMVVGAVIVGFVLFVVSDIVMALGRAGTLPPGLAAWAPAGVSLLFGIATLLHLEDG